MKILAEAIEVDSLKPGARGVALAVGVFDGVHLGHREVIRRTLEDARAAGAASCSRHLLPPSERGGRARSHATAALSPLAAPRVSGVPSALPDAVLVCRFDADFSRQPGEAFVERLREGFGTLAGISVGSGFVFGHRRGGNLELLRLLGSRHGFNVHGVPPVQVDGEVVSSTRIRELVAAGDGQGGGPARAPAFAGGRGGGRRLHRAPARVSHGQSRRGRIGPAAQRRTPRRVRPVEKVTGIPPP